MTSTTSYKTPNAPAPSTDQFDFLRQQIDRLEQQSEGAAQLAEGTAPSGRRKKPRGKPSMSTSATTTSPPAKSNAMTLAELLLVASEYGGIDAKTKDGQVQFDIRVMEASAAGSIDFTPDKHGPGKDDSVMLAEAWVKGRNAEVIFDHKAPNQRKLASTIRLFGKLGASPKYGVGQPMGNVNQLIMVRQNLRKTPTKGRKLDDAHNTLVSYARAQLKKDTLITGEALKEFCFKVERDPATPEDAVKSIQKTAVKVKEGKIGLGDTSPELSTIINACNKLLTAYARAKGSQAA